MAMLFYSHNSYNERVLKALQSKLSEKQLKQTVKLIPSLDSTPILAEKMYSYFESVEKYLSGSFNGFEIGQQLANEDIANNTNQINFLQDVVNCFGALVRTSNFTSFHLDIIRDRIICRAEVSRKFKGSPSFINEIKSGYILELIKVSSGERFNPEEVIVQTTVSLNLPESHCVIRKTDHQGNSFSVNFPIYWIQAPSTNVVLNLTNMDKIRRYCRHNIENKNWNVVSLAEKCHISTRSLQRLMKSKNTTFRQVMTEEKAELAKQLLSEKNSINDIVARLGFSCPSSFNRFFKSATGMTPKDYL